MIAAAPAVAQAPTFNLNPGQEAACAAIIDWVKRNDPGEPFFVLRGYAGTGKTFLVKGLVESKQLGRVCFTAPTNKATKVLRETLTSPAYTPECCTIYSLLGLILEASGEVRELSKKEQDDESLDLSVYKVVVVDEGSMVNAVIKQEILNAAEEHNIKFLFMGDPAQLPPVKELISPIWKIDLGAELTQIMRYDNTILDLATRIRKVVDHPAPSVRIASANDGEEGVWAFDAENFTKCIVTCATKGLLSKPNNTKIVAWRNVTVDKYNTIVRNVLFGQAAAAWLPTDRLIVTSPAKDLEDNKIANTDDEGEVIRAEVGWHPMHPEIKIWHLTVTIDGGRTCTFRALHAEGLAKYEYEVESRASAARITKRLWKDFWEFKDCFHGVRHGYAITAHRSQGSTYENVLVDYRDILLNRNRQEAYRCLYVACTRAKKKLVLS